MTENQNPSTPSQSSLSPNQKERTASADESQTTASWEGSASAGESSVPCHESRRVNTRAEPATAVAATDNAADTADSAPYSEMSDGEVTTVMDHVLYAQDPLASFFEEEPIPVKAYEPLPSFVEEEPLSSNQHERLPSFSRDDATPADQETLYAGAHEAMPGQHYEALSEEQPSAVLTERANPGSGVESYDAHASDPTAQAAYAAAQAAYAAASAAYETPQPPRATAYDAYAMAEASVPTTAPSHPTARAPETIPRPPHPTKQAYNPIASQDTPVISLAPSSASVRPRGQSHPARGAGQSHRSQVSVGVFLGVLLLVGVWQYPRLSGMFLGGTQSLSEQSPQGPSGQIVGVAPAATELPALPIQEPTPTPQPNTNEARAPITAPNDTGRPSAESLNPSKSTRISARRAPQDVKEVGAPPPDTADEIERSDRSPGAFNQRAATNAIAYASRSLSACRDPDIGRISTRADVTFAPSGRVTQVTLQPTLGMRGSPMVGCVVRHLREALVPQFTGEHVTVHTMVTVD